MRARRNPRIGPDDVDRLLAGDPTGPEHRGLVALLEAARSSPSPGELAGERAVVAGFMAAYREAAPTSLPKGRNRARRPSPAGVAALKVAASVAVLAVGGTAVAAETGHLPATAQHHAHRLFADFGVPAPRPTDRPDHRAADGATPGAGPASSAPPATGTATSPTPRPTSADDARVRGLCHAWAVQRAPNGKAMSATSRRDLAALAGGETGVADYCAPYLKAPLPSATPSGPGNGTDGGGDNGNGNGRDGGENNGNGHSATVDGTG